VAHDVEPLDWVADAGTTDWLTKDGPTDCVGKDRSPICVVENGVTPKNDEGGLYVWVGKLVVCS
jgi:hypothetical protein